MKLADVVQTNFNTLSVIGRFGIKLGFGEKSIKQVSVENSINPDFLLDILNTFHDSSYFPQRHLQGFRVIEIVNYLRETHRHYKKEVIPHIESLMNMLLESCARPEEILLVKQFFNDYKDELFRHLTWEDEEIFPYTIDVEEAFISKRNVEKVLEQMKGYSMTDFLNDHDDIEAKLNDIKILFIKYLPPVQNQHLCLRILREFSLLEKDIQDHARIEEKVLGPKIVEMEKVLAKHHE